MSKKIVKPKSKKVVSKKVIKKSSDKKLENYLKVKEIVKNLLPKSLPGETQFVISGMMFDPVSGDMNHFEVASLSP